VDIHKPKPWHGWPEFLKEIGTIVIGVLIALGAEQAVEWLHWQERTRQTEENLRAELHDATLNAVAQLAISKCDNDMLNRLEAAVAASGDDWTPPYVFTGAGVKGVLEAPKGSYTSQAWRDAQADGTINHLPKAELLAFGDIYETAADLKAINEQEEAEMAELNSLGVVRRLDTGTRTEYLRLIWRVRENLTGLRIFSQDLLDQADGLKVKRARIEEYRPAAWAFYQRSCREFYTGKTVIPLD
jgi:hypothetical protein